MDCSEEVRERRHLRVSSPRTRHTAVRLTLFAGVHSDSGERSRCRRPRPSAVLEDTMSKEKGKLVSVKIIPQRARRVPQGSLPTRR